MYGSEPSAVNDLHKVEEIIQVQRHPRLSIVQPTGH
jgi:hypothetical protein